MFDRLKESLGNFKSDVEDEADASEDVESEPDTNEDESEPSSASSATITEKAKSLAKGKVVIEEDDLEQPLQDLKMSLLQANVEYDVAEEILGNISESLVGETRRIGSGTGSMIESALEDALIDVLSVNQFDFDEYVENAEKPVSIVFTGVNGVGKTTTIAKLSRHFEKLGYSSVMANGDTYRAGAQEQIANHAENLDKKLISHEQGHDPTAVLYDAVEYAEANNVDVVLGDTAGRLHNDDGLMDQLRKMDRVVDPDITLFVDEAVAGQDAVNRAREFGNATEADGAILTMAEADDNGGAAISIASETGIPILYLGVGQGYDDIEPFNPQDIVESLLE